MGQPEPAADDAAVAEAAPDLVRGRRSGDIEILGFAAEQEVAHAASDQVGLVLVAEQALHDPQGIGVNLLQTNFHVCMPYHGSGVSASSAHT